MSDETRLDEKQLMNWAIPEAVRLNQIMAECGDSVSVSSRFEFKSSQLSGYILRVELVPENETSDDEEE